MFVNQSRLLKSHSLTYSEFFRNTNFEAADLNSYLDWQREDLGTTLL